MSCIYTTIKEGGRLVRMLRILQYTGMGKKMREINYWEQFMATGKIEDFLAYKSAARQEEQGRTEQSKEYSHAGDDRDYRDGFKG